MRNTSWYINYKQIAAQVNIFFNRFFQRKGSGATCLPFVPATYGNPGAPFSPGNPGSPFTPRSPFTPGNPGSPASPFSPDNPGSPFTPSWITFQPGNPGPFTL